MVCPYGRSLVDFHWGTQAICADFTIAALS
jgi:hypothetical protein